MESRDVKLLVVGAAAWAAAVPLVKFAGPIVANGGPAAKIGMVAFGVGLAACTTPLLSYVLGWRSREERTRGIAIALGTAQTIDGVVHFCWPSFYSTDPRVGLGAAGNIFLGAGLLGIFSAYA